MTGDDSRRAGGGRDDAGYIDLRSYAAIGDGRTVGLIARDGRIDWLPLPDMDGPPVFASILDAENGGYLSLNPVDEYTVERHYVEHTNVLVTEFRTATGTARVTDSLNTGVAGRLPWAELARRIDGVEGEVEMRGRVVPGTCLNSAAPWTQETFAGHVLRVDGLTMALRPLNASSVTLDEPSLTATYRTTPGSRHGFHLVATDHEPLLLPDPSGIDVGVDRTVDNWQAWSEVFRWEGPWQEHVRRSALMLKTLLHSPSGAMVAAATTSLPESLSGGKNWDYRYAWVRDVAYSLTALFRFGLREETHAAISWMLSTVRDRGPEPKVFYRLNGRAPAAQEEVDVPGWRGIGPVVKGNDAGDQKQLGVFGDLFSIVQLYVDEGNVLDAETGRSLAAIADLTCDQWQTKDSGMWELPEERHYVTSKMGCWKALTDAVHLSEIGQIPGDASRWRFEADRIRRWVDEHGWSDERGAYVWYEGSELLDASILVHAVSGFDRGERMSRTLDALRDELGDGPLLYRYSGASKEEGAFVACSFWMVSALALVGRRTEAVALMDEMVGQVNDVGVMSEMIDPATGAFLGNLPQALSHLALVGAAITVDGVD